MNSYKVEMLVSDVSGKNRMEASFYVQAENEGKARARAISRVKRRAKAGECGAAYTRPGRVVVARCERMAAQLFLF